MLKKLRSFKSRSVYDATPGLSKGVWTTPDEEKDYHPQNPAEIVIFHKQLFIKIAAGINGILTKMSSGIVRLSSFTIEDVHKLKNFNSTINYVNSSAVLGFVTIPIANLCHNNDTPVKAELEFKQQKLNSLL
ncbi:Hypothetical predicted protein [Octopus vulgaris]|uniref:Uncharacterized protein n=1 Tax=Octopus vulgaris TaxID=6645 RepID=A0AA36BRM8_OCTVU|nr:Hypothetical predicted protein [Octopus vulgaris]